MNSIYHVSELQNLLFASSGWFYGHEYDEEDKPSEEIIGTLGVKIVKEERWYYGHPYEVITGVTYI